MPTTEIAPTVRVLIVDDQPPFRAAARAVVGRVPGWTLLDDASSGEEAVARCATDRPDLVLMDIHMGAMDGVEATRQIVAAAPATVVVLLSTYAEADLPPAARTSGAAAYVHKDDVSPRLLREVFAAGSADRHPAVHGGPCAG